MGVARDRLTPYLFPEGARFGADHVVLHASSRRHRVENFAGPFSIKTVIRGRVSWTVGGQDLVLDERSLLVLAAGDVYSMNIDAQRPVETACVFFRDGFVEGVARDASSRDPDSPPQRAPELQRVSRIHTDAAIIRQVQRIAKDCRENLMPSCLEENMLLLARDVLLLYEDIGNRIRCVEAEKSSTRQELFRRVEIGREFMHSHAEAGLSLADVAAAAFLSQFHFHRAFAMIWQQTPHQYLTAIRLGRAKELLQAGLCVEEACSTVGFESVSSFSRLFRSHHGLTPGQVRKIGHSSGAGKSILSAS